MAGFALVVDLESLGSWGRTGVALLFLLLISLMDREGFYGPQSDGPR